MFKDFPSIRRSIIHRCPQLVRDKASQQHSFSLGITEFGVFFFSFYTILVHSFPPSHIQIRFLGTSVVPLNKLKGAAAGQSYISIGNVPLSLDFITQDVPTSSCIKFINEMLARAKRVSDGVQSKVLMCSLEKFYHLRTRSMEGAISK